MVVRAARVLTGHCCRMSGRRCGGAARSHQQVQHPHRHHTAPPSASPVLPLSRCLATVAAAPSPLSSSSESWLLVRPAPAQPALARRRERAKLVRVAITAVSTRTLSGVPCNPPGGVRSSSPSVRSSSSRSGSGSRSGGGGGGGGGASGSCESRQDGAGIVERAATAAANRGDGGGGVKATRVVGGRWNGNRANTLGAVERGRLRGGRAASGSSGGSGSSSSGRRVGSEEDGQAVDKESSRVWTVPNIITVGRICFCPVLAGLIVTSQHELALAGLLAASLTDWLDGYIARKWDQKSVLGGFLDPLADKIMVTTVALALGQQGIVPPALVAVMVGRDALLILGSLAYRYKTRKESDAFFDPNSLDYKVTPSTLSKVNTVLQFGTLWLGLTNAVYLVPGDAIFSALCVGTGAATLASGANYLLVSGLKPKGKIGKRLMVQREHLQERYRRREVLVRERMGVGRERMRARQGEFNDKLRARRRVVAGALKDRISRGRQGTAVTGAGAKSRFNKGG